jgi:hypothetical protein
MINVRKCDFILPSEIIQIENNPGKLKISNTILEKIDTLKLINIL